MYEFVAFVDLVDLIIQYLCVQRYGLISSFAFTFNFTP